MKNGASGSDTHWHVEWTVDFVNRMESILKQSNIAFPIKLSLILNMFKSGFFIPLANMPAFSYFFNSLLLITFGKNMMNLIVFNNCVFMFIIMVSVFLIGEKIKNKSVGLIASILLGLMPGIFMMSQEYLPFLQLTALVEMGVLFLIYSDNFKSSFYSILFGIISGIGILTKAQYAFFLIGPTFYVAYNSFRSSSKARINILASLFLVILISSIWWSYNTLWLIKSSLNNSMHQYMPGKFSVSAEAVFKYSYKSIHWYIFYLVQIIAYSFAFLFPVYIALIIKNFKCIVKMPYLKELGLWFIVPYLIFTFVSEKWAKYIFPALPVLALIAAYIIQGFSKKKYYLIILMFSFIASAVQFWLLSFPPTTRLRNVFNNFFPYFQEVGNVHYSLDYRDRNEVEWGKARDLIKYVNNLQIKSNECVVFINYSDSNPYYPTIYLLSYAKLYYPESSHRIIPMLRVISNLHGQMVSNAVKENIKYAVILAKDEKIYSLKLEEGTEINEKQLVKLISHKYSLDKNIFAKCLENRE